jgi:hypothetical protein
MNETTLAGVPAYRCYATERWANAILKVVTCPDDPRTLEHWGRLVGASRGTLASWCRAAHASPRGSLQLARLVRALNVTAGNLRDIQDAMDIVEPRTIVRMLARAGFSKESPPSSDCGVREFLKRQSLVQHPRAVTILESVLERQGLTLTDRARRAE